MGNRRVFRAGDDGGDIATRLSDAADLNVLQRRAIRCQEEGGIAGSGFCPHVRNFVAVSVKSTGEGGAGGTDAVKPADTAAVGRVVVV